EDKGENLYQKFCEMVLARLVRVIFASHIFFEKDTLTSVTPVRLILSAKLYKYRAQPISIFS
ncbi:hypothetical protein CI592_17615, partial [Fischerella thermalis CCMEE 5328]